MEILDHNNIFIVIIVIFGSIFIYNLLYALLNSGKNNVRNKKSIAKRKLFNYIPEHIKLYNEDTLNAVINEMNNMNIRNVPPKELRDIFKIYGKNYNNS